MHPRECGALLKFAILLQVLALEDGYLAPSACTWDILVQGGKVSTGLLFLQKIQDMFNKYIPTPMESFDDFTKSTIEGILRNSFPENEGFTQTLVGPIMAQVVDLLNKKSDVQYKFSIFPIVKDEADRRHNKRSDYSIYRIYNKRTYVVVECKLSVSAQLSVALLDYVSQLLLESFYVYQREGCQYRHVMCILTDCYVWHVLVMDFGGSLWEPVNYLTVASLPYTVDVRRITEIIIDYVPDHLTVNNTA